MFKFIQKTASNNRGFWYLATLLLISLLYTLARFPGLESHSGYFGMAFSIIHPDSFHGDITNNFHPAMVSWYTLLVKLAGDLWLDDRFNIVVYFTLVIITIFGIDKITQLMGVKKRLGRLAVIAILLVNHTFIDSVTQIVDHTCYRPSTFAYPLGIWLAYFLLKGNCLKEVLAFSFLLVSMSVKNGWFPSFMAIIITLSEQFRIKWSRIVISLGTILILIFSGYYIWMSVHNTITENAFLFNLIASNENSEANPFLDGFGPFLYIGLLLGTFSIKFPDNRIRKRIRAICVISGIVYLSGGIYYTFAPPALKIPLFVAFAVSRSTWLTQIIVFIYLSSYAIMRLDPLSLKNNTLVAIAILCIYIFPVFDYYSLRLRLLTISPPAAKRFIVVSIVTLGMLALYFVSKQKILFTKRLRNFIILPSYVILLPLIISGFLSLSQRTYTRIPQLTFLLKYGIMGNTGGAQWVGINEFLRYKTDKNATVIALNGPNLNLDLSLRIRSGRTMPIAHPISFYFNYKKHLLQMERKKIVEQLSKHWLQCDYENIKRDLILLNNPNYIVIPIRSLCDPNRLNYSLVKEINSFAILQKKDLNNLK